MNAPAALGWRKSSRSVNNGNCVEVAAAADVHVRDTKDPGAVLTVSAGAWTAFTRRVKS